MKGPIIALAFLATAVYRTNAETEDCVDGVCSSERVLPTDADPATDCFTITGDVAQNQYKEIDFSKNYLPTKSYTCVEMKDGASIGKQGFKGSTFDKFVLPHTVNDIGQMAFKQVLTTTGKPLEFVQMCNPTDSSYADIFFHEQWAQNTEPWPELSKECPDPELSTAPAPTSGAGGRITQVKVGKFALLGLIVSAMLVGS